MAKLKLIGAVAVKVRPDTDGFRRKTKDDIDNALKTIDPKLKVDVKVDADTKPARRAGKKLKDDLEDEGIKVRFEPDYDSLRGATARVNKMLDGLEAKVEVVTDKASMLALRSKLKELTKDSKAKVTLVQDEKGYQDLLTRIRSIQREKREIKFDLAVDDSTLEAKAKELELKLKTFVKPVKVEYKVQDDREGWATLAGKLEDLKRERAKISVDVEMNDEAIDKALRDARLKMAELTHTTPAELRVRLHSMDLRTAEHEAKKLKDHIDRMQATMQVGLSGTTSVAAHVAYLARTRIVDLFVKVNRKSMIVAEGLLKSLAGINTLNSAGKLLENLFTKFDKVALSVTGIATVLGGLANAALYAASSLLSIGGGIAQSVGLLATAPAMVTALTSAVVVYLAAFKNFKGAIDGNAEAMASLPPAAREAATALQGVWTAIQKPIQKRFWDGMGTSIQDAVTHGLDPLKKGLADTGEAFGKLTAGILNSFRKIAENGQLDEMFANLSLGMGNLANAAEPFFDAFNKLGFEGSKFLPQFGTWVDELATRFDDWITKAQEAGKISVWIDHGVESLKNMWNATGDVLNMFKALTRAANDSGATGLAGFANNMDKIAKKMMGEPWQSQMSAIFEGARKGASELNVGVKDLGKVFMDSAVWSGKMLTNLGKIGGDLLTGIALVFNSGSFQSGTMLALEGMIKMLDDLKPGFQNLGSIIGNLSTVAASIFGSIGETLTSVVGLLDKAVGIMVGNLSEIAPRLLGAVTSIVTAITPTVLALANGLNGILGFVNKMPAGIGVATAALAAFLALRGMFGSFYKSFTNSGAFKTMENNWRQQQAVAGNANAAMGRFSFGKVALENATGYVRNFTGGIREMNTAARQVNVSRINDQLRLVAHNGSRDAGTATRAVGLLGGAINRLGVDARVDANRAANGLSTLASRTQTSTRIATGAISGLTASMQTISTTGAGIAKSAAGGLMSALGGPWGVALAVAGAGLALYAQSQQKAKAHVDSLTQSIDKQTGSFSTQGIESITKAWTDLDEAGNKWANGMRNFKGAEAGNETAKKLGLSIGAVTQQIVDGGPAIEGLIGNISTLGHNMKTLDGGQREVRKSGKTWTELKDGAEGAAKALGFNVEELEKMGVSGDSLIHLANNLQIEADAAKLSQAVHESLAKATGTSSVAAQQMADAMKTIGDESITASQKIGAINKALDLLKGGQLSAREAVVAAQSVQQAAVEQAKGLAEQLGGNIKLMQDGTRLIDVTSASGLALQQAMSSSANGIKEAAMAAYQEADRGGKTSAESWAAAKAILDGGSGSLQEIADAAGISVGTLQAEWDGFFGKDYEMEAIFSANAERFEAVRAAVTSRGKEFNETIWKAFLDANPDAANLTIEQVRALAEAWAKDNYPTTIDADVKPAERKIEKGRELAQALADERFAPTLDANGVPIADKLRAADAAARALEKAPIVPTINANPIPFQQRIEEVASKGRVIDGTTYTPDFNANPNSFLTKLEDAKLKARTFAGNPVIPKLGADPAKFNSEINTVTGKGNSLERRTFRPTVTIGGGASGALSVIQNQLNMLPSYLRTTYEIQTIRTGGEGGRQTGGVHTNNADGSLKLAGQSAFNARIPSTSVRYFADGGFSTKPMSAHIARAGSYVTYAESETGGEAFIPLAASKRKRSMEIWKETGRQLGATGFADGGIVGGSSGPTINVTNHYPVAEKTSVTINRSLQFAGAVSPS